MRLCIIEPDQNHVFSVEQGLFFQSCQNLLGCGVCLFFTHLLSHFWADEEKLKKKIKTDKDRQLTSGFAVIIRPKDYFAASSIETPSPP